MRWSAARKEGSTGAQHEAMASVEHGGAALSSQVEGVLRQVILARNGLRRRSGDVERRDVIDGVRPSIRREERETVPEALTQAGFKGVITGIREAGDFTDRTIDTILGFARVHPE